MAIIFMRITIDATTPYVLCWKAWCESGCAGNNFQYNLLILENPNTIAPGVGTENLVDEKWEI